MHEARSLQEMQETAKAVIENRCNNAGRLRVAANELLLSEALLNSLKENELVRLFRGLFPHLTSFTPGLFNLMRTCGLPDTEFTKAVEVRAKTITSKQLAQKNRGFLLWLLSPVRSPHIPLKKVLSSYQLNILIETVKTYTPDLARNHRIVLLSWAAARETRRAQGH